MQGPSPTTPVFVACAFKDVPAAERAARELLSSGIDARDVGLAGTGATSEPVKQLAADMGVREDVDPEDPLAGAPGLGSAATAASAVDRGAVIGGLAGAVAGLIVGFIPSLHLVQADPSSRVLADALLLFILGALAGAVVGGALAPQRSSHTAFRIVDELEHGAVALVASLDASRAADAVRLLASAGGMHIVRVPDE